MRAPPSVLLHMCVGLHTLEINFHQVIILQLHGRTTAHISQPNLRRRIAGFFCTLFRLTLAQQCSQKPEFFEKYLSFFGGVLSKLCQKSRFLTWVLLKLDKILSFFRKTWVFLDPEFFSKYTKKSLTVCWRYFLHLISPKNTATVGVDSSFSPLFVTEYRALFVSKDVS